jgi:acetyl-CoA synthetase (ADP-forming)
LLAQYDRQPGLLEAEATRPADLPSPPDFSRIAAGAQTESEVKALLESYGIRTAKQIFAETPQAVGDAAGKIGFPVVLKISSRDIVHKSDVGAVKLGITDRAAAIDAANDMLTRLKEEQPAARVSGFSVQEMVRGEAEVIVGIRRDPQFGPLVIVGLGGIAVEIIGDVAVASAPVSRDHVRKMIDGLATATLFKGARGKPPLDIDAIASAVERISWLAYDLGPRLVDLEVNPLIVGAEGRGAVAVDGRANIGPA